MLGPHRVLDQRDRPAHGRASSSSPRCLVVWVAIMSPRREQRRPGEVSDGASERGFVVCHGSVGEPQPDHLGMPCNAERLERGRPFLGAQFGEHATRRQVTMPERRFTVRDGEDAQTVTAQHEFSHQPPDAEHLVVGMGCDDGQSTRGLRPRHPSRGRPRPPASRSSSAPVGSSPLSASPAPPRSTFSTSSVG